MTPGERRWHDFSQLLVGGTGLVFLWMAWFLTPVDDWSVVNHPWQPTVQHLHVLTAPTLVFTIGLIWRVHLKARVQNWRHTLTHSGLIILALFLPMAASGYLLQVSVDPVWRDGWAWLHGVSGLLWVGGSAVHVLGRSRRV